MAPVSHSEGFLKVQAYGVWYTYCAPDWGSAHSSAICSVLGYQDLSNVQWITSNSTQVRNI